MVSPKELAALLRTCDEAQAQGLDAALATVVAVEGSSYRRPGARMLVREDGMMVGGVSGGCLEEDVIRKCRHAMGTGEPVLLTYDTTDEEDGAFGTALGCGGTIRILVEPLSRPRTQRHIEALRAAFASREPTVIALAFEEGDKGVVEIEGAQALVAARERALRSRRWQLVDEVLLDYLRPVPRLLVVGAGPDVEPLVQAADLLGYEVLVLDPRPGFISRRNFPAGVRRLMQPLDEAIRIEALDEHTACVVASHSYSLDRQALERVLASAAGYIGLLGPKHRSKRLLGALRTADKPIGIGLQRLHTPVGLDIGADTPEQVSLAILAEIQAVFAQRAGGFLRDRNGPIHRDVREPDMSAAHG